VQLSPSRNQYPTFYRSDALPVTQEAQTACKNFGVGLLVVKVHSLNAGKFTICKRLFTLAIYIAKQKS